MRNSLAVLTVVPCLLMATTSWANGKPPPPPAVVQQAQVHAGASSVQPSAITYVEIIQLDPQTQVFWARLVDVTKKMTLIDVTGKGTQLQDFQKQSAAIAPRAQTISLMGPLATTSDVIVRPPVPPGPTGDDLIKQATQLVQSFQSIQTAQLQIQLQLKPNVLTPSAVQPKTQPATTPATSPAVRP